MTDVVDIRAYPYFLCIKIDESALETGSDQFKNKMQLGSNLWVEVKITDKTNVPLQNYVIVGKRISLGIHFYRRGDYTDQLFRVDNAHDFLHFHSEEGGKSFSEHQKIEENVVLSQLVFNAFQSAERIIRVKFPEIVIDERKIKGALWVSNDTDYPDFKRGIGR